MPRLAALLSALSLAACGARAPAPGPPVAVATIPPLADLVARVAGPGWRVETVVPPGVSPHVFEPAPSDLRKLVDAELVVVAGAGDDDWIRRGGGAAGGAPAPPPSSPWPSSLPWSGRKKPGKSRRPFSRSNHSPLPPPGLALPGPGHA
ncbi:MAG TPA: metal ABC transporter substrate-binding protein, partial [Thermoanaerobaculia bacterium]|nr:metal ABC transporter substrate-binding protein [Thermoanaerobaculia bacterium]